MSEYYAEGKLPPFPKGDGVTDDTEAIQWWFDFYSGWGLPLPPGRYLIKGPIELRPFAGGPMVADNGEPIGT